MGFEISVEDFPGMAVSDPTQELLQDASDFQKGDFLVLGLQIAFQVELVEVEDQLETLFLGFVLDIEEVDDVGVVFECFE